VKSRDSGFAESSSDAKFLLHVLQRNAFGFRVEEHDDKELSTIIAEKNTKG